MLLDLDTIKTLDGEVREELENGRYRRAALKGRQLSPRRVASILAQAGSEAAIGCLRAMERKRAGKVLAAMPAELVSNMLSELPLEEAARLLNGVPPDDLGVLLNAMDEDVGERLLKELEARLQSHMAKVTLFSPGSAGRIMSPHFLSVKGSQTVEATLESIVSVSPEAEKAPYIYVLDGSGRPMGVVSLKDLLRVERTKEVREVMAPNIIVAGVHDSAREASLMIRNRRFMMLPVVDEQGFIVGVITFDDAMNVLSRDAADLFTGVPGTSEESFFTPPVRSVRSRLPWMVLNVFLNMAAVSIITGFEATIATVAILAAFIPMITDMGGNVGIQALSVAIRSIALGEAGARDIRKVVRKETAIGLMQGLALGAVFALIAFLLRGNVYLGLVAGVALGVNVLIAGVVGGVLPFLIKAMGRDPAMMTGPFLTTVTDISGVSIYLAMATLFIGYL